MTNEEVTKAFEKLGYKRISLSQLVVKYGKSLASDLGFTNRVTVTLFKSERLAVVHREQDTYNSLPKTLIRFTKTELRILDKAGYKLDPVLAHKFDQSIDDWF
jgi:hypothetical protein